MKYAIYDKATNAYLTKMIFDIGYSDNTKFECEITEYITKARLLGSKEAANKIVTDAESFKFMENGRFVVHSFDDTLNDQYIISEAGNPTKVVDNITVDLNGTINVKYGTMMSHWSTMLLENAVNRMFVLQNAASDIYTSWNNTFDIYKVITIMDEKEHTHYQFINVTAEGLEKYSKDEEEKILVVGKELTDITDPLHKRIEELEKDNSVVADSTNYHNECQMVLADMIRTIKYAIYYIKDGNKRDNYISYMTDKIKNDETFNRPELKTAKNDIPKICKYLTAITKNPLYKRIEELEKANYELGEQVAERGIVANRLLDENNSLKTKVEAIKKEARNWKYLYEKVNKDREVLTNVIDNIYDDLGSTDIRKDLKETYDYVKTLSELNYIKIHNDDTDDGKPIYITAAAEFKYIINQMIVIMEGLELNQSVAFASADEVHKAMGVADDIISICEADDKFEVTLKKFSELYETIWIPGTSDDVITHAFKSILFIFSTLENEVRKIIDKDVANRDSLAEVIFAIRNAIYHNDSDAFRCIENRMKIDKDFNSDPFMAGVRENIKDICTAEKKNIANNELKNSEIARLAEEKEKALERAEKFKGIANSVYGMIIPVRCCGKQKFVDVATGKKIIIDKKKYDDLVEYVANINLTYDTMFCMMDKPVYLSAITESLNDLTK